MNSSFPRIQCLPSLKYTRLKKANSVNAEFTLLTTLFCPLTYQQFACQQTQTSLYFFSFRDLSWAGTWAAPGQNHSPPAWIWPEHHHSQEQSYAPSETWPDLKRKHQSFIPVQDTSGFWHCTCIYMEEPSTKHMNWEHCCHISREKDDPDFTRFPFSRTVSRDRRTSGLLNEVVIWNLGLVTLTPL